MYAAIFTLHTLLRGSATHTHTHTHTHCYTPPHTATRLRHTHCYAAPPHTLLRGSTTHTHIQMKLYHIAKKQKRSSYLELHRLPQVCVFLILAFLPRYLAQWSALSSVNRSWMLAGRRSAEWHGLLIAKVVCRIWAPRSQATRLQLGGDHGHRPGTDLQDDSP